MENGFWVSLALAEALEWLLVPEVVWIQKRGQEALVAVEKPYAVRNGHLLDVENVVPLCLRPYPCSHVLRQYCGLLVGVSVLVEDPESLGYFGQSDLDWPLGLMLLKSNEM